MPPLDQFAAFPPGTRTWGRAVTLHITVVNLKTTNSGALSPKSHPNRDPNLVNALPLRG